MLPMTRCVACLVLLIGFLVPAAMAEAKTAQEIADCVRENVQARTAIQTVALIVTDRVGVERTSRAKIYWQRDEDNLSRVLMRFEDPPNLRNSAVLLLEKKERSDLFTYLPELGKSRRVAGHMMSGSFFGTDFTYEQFQRMQGLANDASVEKLENGEIDGQAVYLLKHIPDPEEKSQFESVVTYVGLERCVPLKVEYYEAGNRLRKVMTVDPAKIEEIAGSLVPREARMRDLRDGSTTVLIVEDIDVDTKVHRKYFTQRELERGR